MNQMNDRRADTVGTLRISREVLSTIAATAASEVAGVHSLTAAPVDLKGMFSKRQLPKSVAVTLRDDIAEVELHREGRDSEHDQSHRLEGACGDRRNQFFRRRCGCLNEPGLPQRVLRRPCVALRNFERADI